MVSAEGGRATTEFESSFPRWGKLDVPRRNNPEWGLSGVVNLQKYRRYSKGEALWVFFSMLNNRLITQPTVQSTKDCKMVTNIVTIPNPAADGGMPGVGGIAIFLPVVTTAMPEKSPKTNTMMDSILNITAATFKKP